MKKLLYLIFSALLFTSCYHFEVSAQGPQAEEITITSEIFSSENPEFNPPDQQYVDENGVVYSLDSWRTIELPDKKAEKIVENEVIYEGMEYTDRIPPTSEITIYNEYNREKITSDYPVQEVICLAERWETGMELPITYHDYHSDAYYLGDYLIMPDEDRPKLEGYEGVLLAMAELPESDYHLTGIEWRGEPYQDESGQWCRDAAASGEKRLCDYQVRYGGKAVLTKQGGIQWEAVYRTLDQPAETFEESIVQTEPETMETKEMIPPANWKNWIRTTVIITVSIGVLLILAACLIYLVRLLKEKKKHNITHDKRR
ncbi:hypothetical protein GPL15_12820 [Clostridium sp. MCC353]|uniref:hypothetical protein n=1 Tax=Clostridium sp. MCC353 TaxID=2592646 RepID=UPI001C009626|nr:hypothetical protein [Clostridium sp. MCC353]MBT9777385.1 hypothetical protein [Clostridium sp. MCC353]